MPKASEEDRSRVIRPLLVTMSLLLAGRLLSDPENPLTAAVLSAI